MGGVYEFGAEILVKWSIQKQGLFYNGLSIEDALKSPRNGFHSQFLHPELLFQARLLTQIRRL